MAKGRTRSRSTAADRRGPDPRIRELYAVSPTEFVAARDALARSLATEGSSDAARVKRLRRPPLAVWLLNAVARERPDAITKLFAAGDRLRQAQIRAVGGDATEMRASGAGVRDAVATGLAAAREIAAGQDGGMGTTVLDQVERALRAVATADVVARTPLQQGVLEQLPAPGGIELLTGLAAVRQPAGGRHETRSSPAVRERAPERHVPRARDTERKRKAIERRNAQAEAARREPERRQTLAEATRRERAFRAAADRLHKAERKLEKLQQHVVAVRKDAEAARQAALAARARADAGRSLPPGADAPREG